MKNEFFLGILLFGILGASIGFVIPAVKFENINTVEIRQSQNVMNYTNFTSLIISRTNICEECHLSGKKYIPQAYELKSHTRGGALCLNCHRIFHDEHPINDSITCTACHGEISPTIPASGNEESLCNNCHGYPDALIPSKGDLMVIHGPRGINCIDCHIKCDKCHQKIIQDKGWNNRINHLNAFFKE